MTPGRYEEGMWGEIIETARLRLMTGDAQNANQAAEMAGRDFAFESILDRMFFERRVREHLEAHR